MYEIQRTQDTYLVLGKRLDLRVDSGLVANSTGKTNLAGVALQSTEDESVGHSLDRRLISK